jgi:hypothetical protein
MAATAEKVPGIGRRRRSTYPAATALRRGFAHQTIPAAARPVAAVAGRVVYEAKRMPSLRSERETRERQAVGQISILSRLTSFPARLAAGRACMLPRLCAFAEQTSLPPVFNG